MASNNFEEVASSLTLEPNPFEQSFASKSKPQQPLQEPPTIKSDLVPHGHGQGHHKRASLPGVHNISSPMPLLPAGVSAVWNDSLRNGKLSPAILSGPVHSPFPVSNQPLPSPSMLNLPMGQNSESMGLHRGSMSGVVMPQMSQMPHMSQIPGLQMPPSTTSRQAPMGHHQMFANAVASHQMGRSSTGVSASSSNTDQEPRKQPSKMDASQGHSENAAASSLYLLSHGRSEAGNLNVSSDAVTASAVPTNGASPSPNPNTNTNTNTNTDSTGDKRRAKQNKRKDKDDEEEKRKQFLERNRLAAVKCRQRKKVLMDNLRGKAEYYINANEELAMENNRLRQQLEAMRSYILSNMNALGPLPPHLGHIFETMNKPSNMPYIPNANGNANANGNGNVNGNGM